MSEIQTSSFTTVEIADKTQPRFFDFDRVQVAPQTPAREVQFSSLSLTDRQALLEKLIKRIKSL